MTQTKVDVVVVGAGFAGIYALYKFRGQGMSVLGFEAAADVGGVWYHNSYPGARCDVESIDYSYSFSDELQQEWEWTERYAGQPEIQAYMAHVVDRFDLRRSISFNTRVTSARRDADDARWLVETDGGEVVSCQYLVMASGSLSAIKEPDFEGLHDFAGEWYQTSNWPKAAVDFTGKKVGLIGTGSSGIQSGPKIAETAGHLTVFQRTATFTIPARNMPADKAKMAQLKARYSDYRKEALNFRIGSPLRSSGRPSTDFTAEERQKMLAEQWDQGGPSLLGTFTDGGINKAVNDEVAGFVHARIRETVQDPAVADLLSPKDHPIGGRRICIDTDYYATYNRPNVSLVDVRSDPIARIVSEGVQTRSGKTYPLDMLVFALGFDASTGALTRIDIRNAQGISIAQKWEKGAPTYLGLMTAGFPNLFIITGPQSPSVLVNMVAAIEHDVDWLGGLFDHMKANGYTRIEADPEAEQEWTDHVQGIGATMLMAGSNSYYFNSNIPGKARYLIAYPLGLPTYRKHVQQVVDDGYRGFTLR